MKLIDLTNQRFGRLCILKRSGSDAKGQPTWHCRCDCGNIKIVRGADLRTSAIRSCGCLQSEQSARRMRLWGKRSAKWKITHGESTGGKCSKEYRAWRGMKARCENPRETSYKNYGGRGILVCDRWLNSFENFLADMGRSPSPKHSIDRINNDGNYEPANCRWATPEQQNGNRRKWGKRNATTIT